MATHTFEVDEETGLVTWDWDMIAGLPPEADLDGFDDHEAE